MTIDLNALVPKLISRKNNKFNCKDCKKIKQYIYGENGCICTGCLSPEHPELYEDAYKKGRISKKTRDFLLKNLNSTMKGGETNGS